MRKKQLFTIGFIMLILFIGYLMLPKDTGVVLRKSEDSIWIVGVSPEKMKGKTIEELREQFTFSGVIYQINKIPSFIKNKIKEGDTVRVFMLTNRLYASAPAKGDAFFLIKIGEHTDNPLTTDQTEPELLYDPSIIQKVYKNKIFVNGAYFKIDKAVINTTSGKTITAANLQVGDLVDLKSTSEFKASLPSQGEAIEVTLHDNEYSKKISEGIRYFLDHQKMGKIIIPPSQSIITKGDLIIHFSEWKTKGKKYKAILNLKTKDLKVTEI
jgi:hypothetical protein